MRKPNIGITIGDYNGIGPEVVLKSLQNKKILSSCNVIIIADKKVLDSLSIDIDKRIRIHDCNNIVRIKLGKPTILSGKASLDYISNGINMIREKTIDCLVTGPISKTAISLAGSKFKGHTDLLASAFNVKNVVMAFFSNKINVSLASIHIPISKVPGYITQELVFNQISIVNKFLKVFLKNKNPRIGICGFNPHASEDGNIGFEDLRIISPAVKLLRKNKIDIVGPLPADTIFIKKNREKFDIIHAIYHDQGLIPFKMLAFDKGVNVTLNLPFVRTSPDHGTAYDIAGLNKANSVSMEESILLAVKMYRSLSTGRPS